MTKMNLVIVESPAKAKTIEKFLGKDYSVMSSFGHIRDLPKKNLGIDKDNNFEPSYEISQDKKKIVSDLKKVAKTADAVWLASDEDREGEAIAWHLCHALDLDPKTTKRIVFHEITKSAIDKAVANPRNVDVDLVNAQQARRVLDRLVGYELSPVLWRKVSGGLSAGRVQSVAVRLIVDKENEIKKHVSTKSFKVTGKLSKDSVDFDVKLDSDLPDEKTTRGFFENIKSSTLTVSKVEKKEGKRTPSAPFITSTLQQEAGNRLGYSLKQTMGLAQRLYESGHITYMRTDSTNLSGEAIAKITNYVQQQYGDKYIKVRQFKTKNQNAQEAHEAIRPTNITNLSPTSDQAQNKLYSLIWQRAVASQMSEAIVDKTKVTITPSGAEHSFIAEEEILKFDGFLVISGGPKNDATLPNLKEGDSPSLIIAEARESYTKSPARYTEPSLVKKLEELGIGRPSTYAPTISTVQTRGYVEKGNVEGESKQTLVITLNSAGKITDTTEESLLGQEKNKLLPTHLATMVNDFLEKYFEMIVDYNFTAKSEEQLDLVAEGKEKWQTMIDDFYKKFHPLIVASDVASRQETSQAKLIGLDPKNKKPIYARFGRFGPMIQRGETEDKSTKPDFAPLPSGKTIDNVTLEDALVMFQLPRLLGKTNDGEEIKANLGRFGPYVQVGKKFVSIKPLDPFTITLEEALAIIEEKSKESAKKVIQEFPKGLSILNGPYGPYVTDGKKNAPIAKSTDPKNLSLTEAKEILDTYKPKPRRKSFKK
ncbi:DNA topoisomerase I [Candidatus Saccharibacteria bacterium RIFCSPHIGHO2_12_FULL_41_12]|nr:MAG: DNA topoisomerase I [Candidatus Saccharibacteria bacterium RIFCSPHIGHO2_12_FULL_41_12]